MLGGSFPELNGVGPMPQTKALMAATGSTSSHFHIHTPICNPSRSSLLSGKYFHNIKTTGGSNKWLMHVDEDKVNAATFAKSLKEDAGYTVGMFGKYMNVMPKTVPAGFDAWMGNGGGNYIAPSFQTSGLEGFTGIKDGMWHGTSKNYTTASVGNVSIAWIESVVKKDPTQPFFAYIAPKAAHEPFNPAPWYVDHWDAAWPAHEPRPAAWNSSSAARANHNGVVATMPMLSDDIAEVITDVFKNRWRTLMSVDDVIASVIATCKTLGVHEQTYYFYSSDHGFQLGEFNIPMDKRHVYDWDTKIHLLATGPGIKANSILVNPATQVDLAPTFLGLAGVTKPADYDGKSLVPLLVDGASEAVLDSTRRHLAEMGSATSYAAAWRTSIFFEYYFVNDNAKCVEGVTPGHYPTQDSNCGILSTTPNSQCWGSGPDGPHAATARPAPTAWEQRLAAAGLSGCYATESWANNFIALRSMEGSAFGNTLYAEYQVNMLYCSIQPPPPPLPFTPAFSFIHSPPFLLHSTASK